MLFEKFMHRMDCLERISLTFLLYIWKRFGAKEWIWYDTDHVSTVKGKHLPHYSPFVREITDDRRILLTKASDAELWYFLWSSPEQTVEHTNEMPVIWDTIAPMITSIWGQLNAKHKKVFDLTKYKTLSNHNNGLNPTPSWPRFDI